MCILVENQMDVPYKEMLSSVCKGKLYFNEKMDLDIFPCSFWRASHDDQPCMALVYNGKVDDCVQFSEFIEDMLKETRNILKPYCVHLDENSDNPVLIFEPEQSLKDYCTSCGIISEIDQLTILRDITKAVGNLGFLSNAKLKVTIDSVFIQENSNGERNALFCSLYQHSYFPQTKPNPEPQTDYKWVKDTLLLMQYRDQCSEHSELPKSHILYNIFKYRWFLDEENLYPNDNIEVAKEITYILGKSFFFYIIIVHLLIIYRPGEDSNRIDQSANQF